MYRLRPALIIGAALCFPVFMFTYARMLIWAFNEWPTWGIALTFISHAVAFIGFGCLLDQRAESRKSADQQDWQ